jgi:aminomethyltransferase
MAVQFEGIVAEHMAVRRAAGLFDISHMGRLLLTGAGADAAVERLLTRRTTDMAAGDIRYSFLCDESGNILDDLMVSRRGADDWQLVVNAANRQRVVAQIAAAGYGSLLEDRTLETAMLAVQGPHAEEFLGKAWPASRATARKRYVAWSADRRGATLTGSRSGYTGEDGFEIYGEPSAIEALWLDLRRSGATACGLGARDSLRNEAALPLYGHELRETTSPWELGLAYAVSLEKEFIGRAELQRRREALGGAGSQKRVGLVLTGRRIARETMHVFRGPRQVGEVTSGTWSPLAERPIAQAYLDADVAGTADSGAAVEIDVRGRSEQAHVVSLKGLLRRG